MLTRLRISLYMALLISGVATAIPAAQLEKLLDGAR